MGPCCNRSWHHCKEHNLHPCHNWRRVMFCDWNSSVQSTPELGGGDVELSKTSAHSSLGSKIVWGNGAPIPGFPQPHPKFSGTGLGLGQASYKFWGIFGDGNGLNFGVFWGFIPVNPQKIIGETLGTGIGSSFGIYWGFPPKKTHFWGIPRRSPFWWIISLFLCIQVLLLGARGLQQILHQKRPNSSQIK